MLIQTEFRHGNDTKWRIVSSGCSVYRSAYIGWNTVTNFFFFFHTRPLIQFHDRGTLTEIHTKLKSLKKWFTSQHCCTWTKQIKFYIYIEWMCCRYLFKYFIMATVETMLCVLCQENNEFYTIILSTSNLGGKTAMTEVLFYVFVSGSWEIQLKLIYYT